MIKVYSKLGQSMIFPNYTKQMICIHGFVMFELYFPRYKVSSIDDTPLKQKEKNLG